MREKDQALNTEQLEKQSADKVVRKLNSPNELSGCHVESLTSESKVQVVLDLLQRPVTTQAIRKDTTPNVQKNERSPQN